MKMTATASRLVPIRAARDRGHSDDHNEREERRAACAFNDLMGLREGGEEDLTDGRSREDDPA